MANRLIFLLFIFLFTSCDNGSSSQPSTVGSPRSLTTFTVTQSTDNNPGGLGEVGDLRYALNSMNQSLNTTPDDYAITFAFPMTIQLNGILPIINTSANPVNITIGNSGPTPTVIIDGNNGAYSGFFIPTGNVTIQNITFQNMTARGGDGGDGISGGGGGMGAGGAIYVSQAFLNGSYPAVTLMNVAINNCSAEGGNGGSYFSDSSTGNEGGGGGGGFSGNGGSITVTGSTGGGGGGGFGGNGGDVTLSMDNLGGGGGGGGGIGSRATLGMLTNLGDGGSDQDTGLDGNGYDLSITAGSGGGGNTGGSNAGGGGGGGTGGGGGGSSGSDGIQPRGTIAPRVAAPSRDQDSANEIQSQGTLAARNAISSGGNGGDGGGGGGGGVVEIYISSNEVDAQAGNGGYGGGGGGGAGVGGYDIDYAAQGGVGGIGGGGGGGGVNQSGMTSANGGDSLGGGGGAGGGPSNGVSATGGTDTGHLGGGSGGFGADTYGFGYGGGGGGGGSGLGGAIFVDSNLNLTLQALPGVPTTFTTSNNTTQAGTHGTGGPGGSDGTDGSALGNSIFLRTGSSLTLLAEDADDLLTLGDQVSFVDDTIFGAGGTGVFVRGDGIVVYNGVSDYQGTVTVNNANLKVNGQISTAPVFVCRNSGFSEQRGTLSGHGTVTGDVFANSGTISPDVGETLALGSLTLNPAGDGSLGSLVHIDMNAEGTSLVAVNGPATLAGILEIGLDPNTQPGTYTILTSSDVIGTFDSVTFTGDTPIYSISYHPTRVDFILTNIDSTPPDTPPDAPTDVTATANGQTVILTWTNPPVDFDSVTLRMSTTTYPTSVTDGVLLAENVTASFYSSSDLTPGTTYYFSLFSKDAQGNFSTPATASVSLEAVNEGNEDNEDNEGSADDLTISVEAPSDSVALNSETTFDITIANSTPDDVEDITAILTLSDNLVFISANLSEGTVPTCEGTNPISCVIGSLPADQSVTLTVTVQAVALGSMSLGVAMTTDNSTSTTSTGTGTVIDAETESDHHDSDGGCSLSYNAATFRSDSSFFMLSIFGVALIFFRMERVQV